MNKFSSLEDTLVVLTKTEKGRGLYEDNWMSLYFEDSTENFPYKVVYPKNIDGLKRCLRYVDLKAWRYSEFKDSRQTVLPKYILDDICNQKLDTLNFAQPRQNYIDIIEGRKGDKRVFIVDQNNNKDFTDDSIRLFEEINPRKNLIKCYFNIYNGCQVGMDSTWISIGTYEGDSTLWFCVNEHLIADFFIDNDHFQICIADEQVGFPYHYPVLSLLSYNSNKKDSLLIKELLYPNEYIKLKNTYYRFASVSNSGDYLTLVKESNFENKIGTQVGMIAPDFICKSIQGNIINSSILHDKPIVIANITLCHGDTLTSNEYNKMVKFYGNKIYAIAMDYNIDKNLNGVLVDTKDPFNGEIYRYYRNAFSSRICYIIDENRRIIDKFQTRNWSLNLPKILP